MPRFKLRQLMAANAAIGLACWQVRTRGSLWLALVYALQYASESAYAWFGGFLIGIGLACLVERHGPRRESRPRWWGLAALVPLAAVYLAWAAIRVDTIPLLVYQGWPYPDPAFHAIERLLGRRRRLRRRHLRLAVRLVPRGRPPDPAGAPPVLECGRNLAGG